MLLGVKLGKTDCGESAELFGRRAGRERGLRRGRGDSCGRDTPGPCPVPGGWQRTFVGMLLIHDKQLSPTGAHGVTIYTMTSGGPQMGALNGPRIADF